VSSRELVHLELELYLLGWVRLGPRLYYLRPVPARLLMPGHHDSGWRCMPSRLLLRPGQPGLHSLVSGWLLL
jgi:hypothetical protein